MRRRRTSAGLTDRIQLARERAASANARAAGVAPEDLRVLMLAAFQSWSRRAPWRFLPESLRGALFGRVGRRYAARMIAEAPGGE